jgi:bifunctional DNA-binding transcriptional regulator/antitoxin component of YhaV-PrlF toxin-antitoxin module
LTNVHNVVNIPNVKSEAGPTITARARVRGRNQITIPDRIVAAANIEEGETLVLEVEPEHPEVLRVRRVRSSYAGAVPGMYTDSTTYLDDERKDW